MNTRFYSSHIVIKSLAGLSIQFTSGQVSVVPLAVVLGLQPGAPGAKVPEEDRRGQIVQQPRLPGVDRGRSGGGGQAEAAVFLLQRQQLSVGASQRCG